MEFKITEQNLTSRGSFVVIDLEPFGFKGERMVATQNYLGGGMLGKIYSRNTLQHEPNKPFLEESDAKKLDEIADQLKRYLFDLTNPDSEWESQTYEQNQKMPVSAY